MLEASYEYGNAQGISKDPILDLVKHVEGLETTYEILFNLDDNSIDISNFKKFSSKHPEEYLYITESGNVSYYSASTVNLGNITGFVEKKKKDGIIEESDKKTIIGSLKKEMGSIPFEDAFGLNDIIKYIWDNFYYIKEIIKNNKEIKILALKEKFYKQIIKINNKNTFYTIGFIKNGNKYLFSELKEYKNFLFNYKFDETEKKLKNHEQIITICDFCGKEKELITNFGKSDPYKLGSLKMFGSTYRKGFYKTDNSEINLRKTIRCCSECIKKIKNIDCKLTANHHIITLNPVSMGKGKTEPLHIYIFLQRLLKKNISLNEIEIIVDIVNLLFGKTKLLDTNLSVLSSIKEKISIGIDNIEDISIDLFFEVTDGKQKHQVIYEARNLYVITIIGILDKLTLLSDIRKTLIPSSEKLFSIRHIFELISIFNYKVSLEVLKSFFHKKAPLSKVVLKGMLKHIRSSVYNSAPDNNLKYYYPTLTLDLSLMFSFIYLLNKEGFIMETINHDLVLEKYEREKDNKTRVRAKPIRSFVEKVYADITKPEVSLMEIGEIIHDISSELYQHGKKDREKVFFAKIDYTGMSNKDIEKLLVFINGKVSQYHTDLKYINIFLSEKLNRITIDVNNNTIDKIKSVLRIVDGYNLKKRINIMAAVLNKETEK